MENYGIFFLAISRVQLGHVLWIKAWDGTRRSWWKVWDGMMVTILRTQLRGGCCLLSQDLRFQKKIFRITHDFILKRWGAFSRTCEIVLQRKGMALSGSWLSKPHCHEPKHPSHRLSPLPRPLITSQINAGVPGPGTATHLPTFGPRSSLL